ncbi:MULTISPECIES: hypothetical protein [unclassified Pseudonocardia]|uniref:hypothetical protein n=1 Tax=unclassified Pseudonocardia TaxID=2619320 RepID=UPI0011AE3508|nr:MULTISPECIES: hypothetical protein [unclassified Pseudonocardia]
MSLILAGGVALHAVSSLKWTRLSPYAFLTGSEDPQISVAVAIFAGTAGAAALVAGFAGVVLVFTIGAASPRLRTFRHRGGGSLRRNWIAVVTEPFVATLLGLTAAVTATTTGRGVAPWLFELAVVLLVHAAARLIWILHELVEIVAVDDRILDRKDREVPLDQLFPQ